MYTSRKHTFLRRLLILTGAALLAASAVGASGGNSVRRGGTLHVAGGSLFAHADPAVDAQNFPAFFNATQLTLVAFPDQGGTQIVSEAAALPTVSADGRTYTFRIRRGFRFSDGTPVTAANFAAAFQRIFDPQLQSFSRHRLVAPSYTANLFADVAGANAFMRGKAKSIGGVRAKGDKLVIRLVSPRPDLLARLAMPFVTAVPVDLPVVVGGVRTPYPSAGPYEISEFTPGKSFVLVRNPYWRRDLVPWRPANVDRIVSVDVSSDARDVRAVEEDRLDLMWWTDVAQRPDLVKKYGVDKGRLFVRPSGDMMFIALNNDSPLFRNNPKLRQAVNYALDRPALVRQYGPLKATPTDQVLLPGFPGFHDWRLYPLAGPNLAKARALAKGNLRGGKAVMYTFKESTFYYYGPGVAQVVKQNLARIGLDVTVKAFEVGTMYRKSAERSGWDLSIYGWFPEYLDPYDFLNLLFDGQYIRGVATNGSRFNDPVFNRRLRAAARLTGQARLQAYAALERDLMREGAPIAPYGLRNRVIFVSPSLGCFSWNNLLGYDNWVAVCKK
jgi:peptide/nickel transport system substrate-binding protein